MAKKKKKITKKKTARKPAGGRSRAASSKKKTTKKKPAAARKPARKVAKKVTRKKVTKKKTAKKTTKKTAKKTTKKVTKKKVAKKPVTKKPVTKKPVTKKPVTKKPVAKKSITKKPAVTKKAAADKKKKKKTGGRTKKVLGARSVAEAASAGEADAQGYVYVNGRRVRMISTGGQGIVKKPRSRAKDAEADLQPELPAKPIKTKLTAKELRHYRDLLLEKRGELIGDVAAMENAALQAHGGNLSNLPIHMADIGTDTYDQDFMLGLAEAERKQLREIDEALMRIQNKTYGVCQMTGKTIPKARLNAKPWAKYTIEAARMIEGQWRA
ncbi:MAG: TraR/DksA family transcriptional regulator [Planctomycetes bacterium]|nr:TraR/DksA family transcriptional regulator [Planctomycetota bacterium]